MNTENIFSFFGVIISLLIFGTSCGKYLEEKPNKQLYVPDTWEDLQALLDNNSVINFASTTALIELIADDYYVRDDKWNSVSPDLKGAYIWDDSY